MQSSGKKEYNLECQNWRFIQTLEQTLVQRDAFLQQHQSLRILFGQVLTQEQTSHQRQQQIIFAQMHFDQDQAKSFAELVEKLIFL